MIPLGYLERFKVFFELTAKEKKLDFIWHLDLPDDQWLVGDELRIKQVMNNLLGNAFKFTQEGKVEVKVKWDRGNLEIAISDSGIGMNQEELKKSSRNLIRRTPPFQGNLEEPVWAWPLYSAS